MVGIYLILGLPIRAAGMQEVTAHGSLVRRDSSDYQSRINARL